MPCRMWRRKTLRRGACRERRVITGRLFTQLLYQLFDRIMIRRAGMVAKRLDYGHRGRRSARHAALATLEIVKEPVSLTDHRLHVNRKDT